MYKDVKLVVLMPIVDVAAEVATGWGRFLVELELDPPNSEEKMDMCVVVVVVVVVVAIEIGGPGNFLVFFGGVGVTASSLA